MTDIRELTFPTYEAASLRSAENPPKLIDDITDNEIFNLNSIGNILPLLPPVGSLLGILLSPYIILPTTVYICWGIRNQVLMDISSLLIVTLALICIINIAVYCFNSNVSCINGRVGYNAVGATTKPGLYHSSSAAMKKLMNNCPLLSSSKVLSGSLPKLNSTSWVYTGDMRTLLPYLANNPKKIAYLRRWVSFSVGYFLLLV
jgi:hypothetical protein